MKLISFLLLVVFTFSTHAQSHMGNDCHADWPPKARKLRQSTWQEYGKADKAGWRTQANNCCHWDEPNHPWLCKRVDICWTVGSIKHGATETQVIFWVERENKYWLVAVPTSEIGAVCR